MMRRLSAATIALLLTSVAWIEEAKAQLPGDPVPADGVSAEAVQKSIDNAVLFLQNARGADGTWPLLPQWPGSVTSLVVLSLLTAGVPVSDPSIQEPLAVLRTIRPDHCYQASVQTMVFCLAEPEKDLLLIRRNVTYLEEQQLRNNTEMDGAWNYGSAVRSNVSGDNSNTQFVMLALHEAELVGVPSDERVWRRARDYWIRAQSPVDGSWGYTPGDRGTGSMTCAGIASLIMAAEKLEKGDATVNGDNPQCCGARAVNEPVERGLRWMAANFSARRNPNDGSHLLYYLYGMERVGRLTNQRLIGNADWYREGLRFLLPRQDQLRGCWKGVGPGESNEVIGTALALMFVAKGRRPVLAAKLQFGEADQWERHRKDLAHLTDYCAKRWKQEATWQVIRSQGATAADFNTAPVLYMSGSEKPNFSDAEVKALRQYVDMGGFIFAENCCSGAEFDKAFRALMERVFPERDETGQLLHQLRLLPAEHSIYTAEEPFDRGKLKELPLGIDVGCRTSVVYYPSDLGCYWELDKTGRTVRFPQAVEDAIRAHRSLGINVMAYATNRELKNKLQVPHVVVEEKAIDDVNRMLIYIAEMKHSGGSAIAPTALVNLLRMLRQKGAKVSVEKKELAFTQDALFDHHMVFMHGRTAFTLSDAERKQLKTFVDRGGMLLADSVCSSQEFTASFRREMQAVFPEKPLKAIDPKHPMYGEKFGGFNLETVTLRDPQRVGAGGPVQAQKLQIPPELEGIEIDGRLGVIFSRYDLSCALERQNSLECVGYDRDDAAKIGINIVLFSLRGNL